MDTLVMFALGLWFIAAGLPGVVSNPRVTSQIAVYLFGALLVLLAVLGVHPVR